MEGWRGNPLQLQRSFGVVCIWLLVGSCILHTFASFPLFYGSFWVKTKLVFLGSHGVPSPTHVSKVPTFEHKGTIKIWSVIIKVGWILIHFMQTYLRDFMTLFELNVGKYSTEYCQSHITLLCIWIMLCVLSVRSNFLLDPTLNTSPRPCLQKVLPCRHPCHTCDLGLGTRVKW